MKTYNPETGEVWTSEWKAEAGGGVGSSGGDVFPTGPWMDYWDCVSTGGESLTLETLASPSFASLPEHDRLKQIEDARQRMRER